MKNDDNKKNLPKVTFIILGYNQEKYIAEAVNAALAQTYKNTEIILSDDHSQDSTYDIMEHLVEKYNGPHKVIVRKNHENKGTLSHIYDIVQMTTGRLIILAAGDDVSRADRAEIFVQKWLETGSWGLYSDYSIIDENSRIVKNHEKNQIIISPNYRLRRYLKEEHRDLNIIHGATSAYDRQIFDYFTMTADDFILSEDGFLSILLCMVGASVAKIDKPLVQYRRHPEALTNAPQFFSSWSKLYVDEESIAKLNKSQMNRCRLLLRLNSVRVPKRPDVLNTHYIEAEKRKHEIMASWYNLNLISRWAIIRKSSDREFIYWALPRIMPQKMFITVKWFYQITKMLRPNA